MVSSRLDLKSYLYKKYIGQMRPILYSEEANLASSKMCCSEEANLASSRLYLKLSQYKKLISQRRPIMY